MPIGVLSCVNCVKMDYDVQEGTIPRDFIEYDFAEDALDFEVWTDKKYLAKKAAAAARKSAAATGGGPSTAPQLSQCELKVISIMGEGFGEPQTTARVPAFDETQLAEARDVKFTQTLSEPLSIGAHIVCTGTPSEDLPWFAVNIGTGDPDGRGEVAAHFNVRLPQHYVVRNTRRHDKWGAEETTSFRLFPFKMDRPFTIEVLVEEKETLWAVDGEHYCSYSHRSPSPLAATWVQVAGVRNATLHVDKTDIYPALAAPPVEIPLRPSVDAVPEAMEATCWHPNAIASLSNGVPEGHQIVIHGRLRPLLHSFALELTDYAREWPYPNVHVHANVRAYVESQKDRQLVVFNAWLGAWGAERRQRTARLVPGTQATFRIVRGSGEWCVYADNVLIGELEYRAAPAGVKALRIRGDFYPDDIYLCPASNSPTREDSEIVH